MNGLAQFPCGLCNPSLQGLQRTAVDTRPSYSAETSKSLNTLQKPDRFMRNKVVSPDYSDCTLQWKSFLAGFLRAVGCSPSFCTLQQAASHIVSRA